METLSNILASFDIFQVFVSAFPMITEPIVHAFDQIIITLSGFYNSLFVAHPGITLGIFVLTLGYASVYVLNGIQRFIVSKLRTSKQRFV
jgi:DNA-directed RNA polymerase beta subunit